MTFRLTAILAAAAFLAACAQPEPVVVEDRGMPIFAKDGTTIVGYTNDTQTDVIVEE